VDPDALLLGDFLQLGVRSWFSLTFIKGVEYGFFLIVLSDVTADEGRARLASPYNSPFTLVPPLSPSLYPTLTFHSLRPHRRRATDEEL